MNWSNNFWLFWEIAKIFKRETRILLVHMDEKWFYSMVLRRHSKMIPALGIIPKNTHVHHKKHIFVTNQTLLEGGGRSRRFYKHACISMCFSALGSCDLRERYPSDTLPHPSSYHFRGEGILRNICTSPN